MKDVVDGVVHVDDEIVEWLERREKLQASSLRLFAISAVPHALSDRDRRSHSDLFWLRAADFGPGFALKIRNWIIGKSMWSARIKLSLE
jgi:hypothetical protein